MKIGLKVFVLCAATFVASHRLAAQWIQTNGPVGDIVYSLAVSGETVLAGTYGSDGIYLSTNEGASWTSVLHGLGWMTVYSLAVSDKNVFAALEYERVYRSTDGGTSWNPASSAPTTVVSLAISKSGIFAGTFAGGIFLSTNNGTSWMPTNAGLTSSDVEALAISDTNIFAGTFGAGVFLSTNGGTSWSEVNNGLGKRDVYSLKVAGMNVYAATSGGLFRSTNNGRNWTAINTGLTNSTVTVLAAIASNVFAGTDGGGVFLSTDYGTTWTSINTASTQTSIFSLALSDMNVYAGVSNHGVFRRPLSDLLIPSAPQLSSPLLGSARISTTPMLRWNTATAAATYRLQISTDSNFVTLTYERSGIVGLSQEVPNLANNQLYYWRVNASNALGSGPYSISWTFNTAPAQEVPTPELPLNGAKGVPTGLTLSWRASNGASSYRLQVSSDSTFTTAVYDSGGIRSTALQVSNLVGNTSYYWRVNATGLGGTSSFSRAWSFTTLALTSVEQDHSGVPASYALCQNYPNPFNPSTIIEFSIPRQGPVLLTVFNSLGIEVEVLVSQTLRPGHHLFRWAPRNIPSGVYFYRLRSNEFDATRKLLLIR